MDKKFEKYQGLETDFQITCARYLDSIGAIWFHTPNEIKATISYLKKRKSMGVKSGVPDILIMNERGGKNGLAIELKVGYNKPSDNQLTWLDSLKSQNWAVCWTRSLDEFVEVVDKYMELK